MSLADARLLCRDHQLIVSSFPRFYSNFRGLHFQGRKSYVCDKFQLAMLTFHKDYVSKLPYQHNGGNRYTLNFASSRGNANFFKFIYLFTSIHFGILKRSSPRRKDRHTDISNTFTFYLQI